METKKNTLNVSLIQLQEAVEDLDTKKNIQNLAAAALSLIHI